MTACSRGLGNLCVKEYLVSGDALETAVGDDEGVPLLISIQESNCPDTHLAGNYLHLCFLSLYLPLPLPLSPSLALARSLSRSLDLSLALSISLSLSLCMCELFWSVLNVLPQILTPQNLTETLLWS